MNNLAAVLLGGRFFLCPYVFCVCVGGGGGYRGGDEGWLGGERLSRRPYQVDGFSFPRPDGHVCTAVVRAKCTT